MWETKFYTHKNNIKIIDLYILILYLSFRASQVYNIS